jgi:hypothetical protein
MELSGCKCVVGWLDRHLFTPDEPEPSVEETSPTSGSPGGNDLDNNDSDVKTAARIKKQAKELEAAKLVAEEEQATIEVKKAAEDKKKRAEDQAFGRRLYNQNAAEKRAEAEAKAKKAAEDKQKAQAATQAKKATEDNQLVEAQLEREIEELEQQRKGRAGKALAEGDTRKAVEVQKPSATKPVVKVVSCEIKSPDKSPAEDSKQREDGPLSSKTCTTCKRQCTKVEYSGKQWTAKTRRRCKVCIAKDRHGHIRLSTLGSIVAVIQ